MPVVVVVEVEVAVEIIITLVAEMVVMMAVVTVGMVWQATVEDKREVAAVTEFNHHQNPLEVTLGTTPRIPMIALLLSRPQKGGYDKAGNPRLPLRLTRSSVDVTSLPRRE